MLCHLYATWHLAPHGSHYILKCSILSRLEPTASARCVVVGGREGLEDLLGLGLALGREPGALQPVGVEGERGAVVGLLEGGGACNSSRVRVGGRDKVGLEEGEE